MRHTWARENLGDCSECKAPIARGDHIVPKRSGGWAHIRCAMNARHEWYRARGRVPREDRNLPASDNWIAWFFSGSIVERVPRETLEPEQLSLESSSSKRS